MKYCRIALVALAFCAMVDVRAQAAGEDKIGTVLAAEGEVKILPGGQPPGKPARVEDILGSKDILKTGDDSTAKVMLRNDEVLIIAANTEIDLSSYLPAATEEGAKEQHTIKLNAGKLRIVVKEGYGDLRSLDIRTSNAIAGVVGTDFVVEFSPEAKTTKVSVLSGMVRVAHAWLPGVQVLGPGQFTEVVGEEAPFEPEPLGTDELEKLKFLMVKTNLPILPVASGGGVSSPGSPGGLEPQTEVSKMPGPAPVMQAPVLIAPPEIPPDKVPIQPPPQPAPQGGGNAPPPPPPPPWIPGQR